ncbi:hypothetical protein [uncultured Fibrobacter sp.]|uniref:hypothetical protein n=1 Tax=uncultured Fibrobacter sp. TaxID=261512 RepID=UPI002630EEF3|nr:hypothetical protein [uncultured Fibrobacter sp.]
MKKTLYLAMATISMGLMAGCGDSSSSSSPDDDSRIESSDSINSSDSSDKGGTEEATTVSAFFPEGYDADKVVAWYATDEQTISDKGQTKTMVDAVYLFKDGSFIVTEQKVKEKNNISTFENAVVAEGTWTGSKDNVKNGSLTISLMGNDIPLEIQEGKFSISPFGGESYDFKLVESDVPEASPVTEEPKSDSDDKEDPNGTAEQLAWAKSMIARSTESASKVATFEISEPTWERLNTKSETYNATFTIKVTLSEGEFITEDLDYPTLAIGQYPVHAIDSEKDKLPEQWNNNNWEIKDAKVVGNTMTATMTEKIDNLKVGRAYVFVSTNNGMDSSIEYSEAFFIVPPNYQGDL